MSTMGMNERGDSPIKPRKCHPPIELLRCIDGDLLGQANTYVTRSEMQEFRRGLCELMRIFLDFYIATAMELDTIYLDVDHN